MTTRPITVVYADTVERAYHVARTILNLHPHDYLAASPRSHLRGRGFTANGGAIVLVDKIQMNWKAKYSILPMFIGGPPPVIYRLKEELL